MTKPYPPKSIVLYAEDDYDDLLLLQEAFSRYADTVELVHFDDGDQLLSYIQRHASLDPLPCLIILDINMPLVSGKDASKTARIAGL